MKEEISYIVNKTNNMYFYWQGLYLGLNMQKKFYMFISGIEYGEEVLYYFWYDYLFLYTFLYIALYKDIPFYI